MFKQCQLKKGSTHKVAWIPIKFAKNKYLEIKGEDGWQVIGVSNVILTASQVKISYDQFKDTRKASDI